MEEVSAADTVTFAVRGSNSFHRLELSKSLIRFAEFDFTYFWEQCIEAGRNARKTGRISQNLVNMAMNALVKCHPYVEACANTEFFSVVIDCIIAYICHSEGIGLEELWARCISPKSLYEKAIFDRVSEYKTCRGINQWINIVRMQEYAKNKMQFIYEVEGGAMLSPEEYRTRREYFDLALAVAANETGCPMGEMPSFKVYSPSSLPDSVFMMGRVSKNIYKRLSETLSSAQMWEEKKLNDHNRDQAALDAFSYVKDMPRPGGIDMKFAQESVSALPDEIYVPDSFKAAVDLEFFAMSKNGIYLSKCPRCGRFFRREPGDIAVYCKRINSSGKTCTQLLEEELKRIAPIGSAASVNSQEDTKTAEDIPDAGGTAAEEISSDAEVTAENASGETKAAVGETAAENENTPEKKNDIPEKKNVHPIMYEIPRELDRRCQKVYNLLYKRIGKLMTDREFKEWSKFLTDMKRDLRTGDAEISQLEDFLSYWETAVKKQSARMGKKLRDSEPEQLSFDVGDDGGGNAAEFLREEELPGDAIFNEAVKMAEEKDGSGISPAGTEKTPEERQYKPFNPPKYNTVLEAMLDGKYKSDELLSENTEDSSDIRVNGRKITLPNWERISRD